MKCGKLVFLLLAAICLLFSESRRIERNDWVYKLMNTEPMSSIGCEECFLCGEKSIKRSQDNIGLINMNTFDYFLIEINRYDPAGKIIEKPTGTVQVDARTIGDCEVSFLTNMDQGYSLVNFSMTGENVKMDEVGTFLCQECLEKFKYNCKEPDAVSEIAVFSYSEGVICPLPKCKSFFSLGNYLIGCYYEDPERASLQIIYRPCRYSTSDCSGENDN